jgi:hypothetical protein
MYSNAGGWCETALDDPNRARSRDVFRSRGRPSSAGTAIDAALWLDGGVYRNRTYRPVIRMEPTSGRSVTWAEFVEAGLLREYRRKHNVALSELRTVIDRLRDEYGIPYPLAHHRPLVGPGRELLLEVQQDAGLDADLCLVAVANDQLLLTPAAASFVQRVEWADDIAVSWRPHDDPQSPVRMAPDVRFGRPAIKGISTEVLWERVESGEASPRSLRRSISILKTCTGHWPTKRRHERRDTTGEAGHRPLLFRRQRLRIGQDLCSCARRRDVPGRSGRDIAP